MIVPGTIDLDDDDYLYVKLSDAPIANTRFIGDYCIVDFAADDSIVGVEVVGLRSESISVNKQYKKTMKIYGRKR